MILINGISHYHIIHVYTWLSSKFLPTDFFPLNDRPAMLRDLWDGIHVCEAPIYHWSTLWTLIHIHRLGCIGPQTFPANSFYIILQLSEPKSLSFTDRFRRPIMVPVRRMILGICIKNDAFLSWKTIRFLESLYHQPRLKMAVFWEDWIYSECQVVPIFTPQCSQRFASDGNWWPLSSTW